MSRTSQSIKNIISGIGSQLVLAFLSLFTTRIIKTHLGFEYLGLNGVFTNIISFLSLTELGIGSAIVFALYKPLAEKDEELITGLMQFYKKAYSVIAVVVLFIGLLLIPFLPKIVKSELPFNYILIVYFLFLINSVLSYLLAYKQSLISADQKNYIITTYSLCFSIVSKILQLVVVILTNNYLLFLLISIVSTFLLNFLLAKKTDKIYPFIKNKKKIALSNEEKVLIINKTKAMFLHSIGTFVISGTDNIIISTFLGLTIVGKYGVYISIILLVQSFINQFFNGIYSSIGNYIVEKNSEEQYYLYKKIEIITSFVQIFVTICLAVLFNPFINWWLGEDALLSKEIVYLLSFNCFITIMRKPIHTFKTTSGLFEKDRYAPIIESIINIILSIVLVKTIGLSGVIIGTIVSSLFVPVWVTPHIVYKYLFKQREGKYYLNQLLNTIITIGIVLILNYLIKLFSFTNNFQNLVIQFCIVIFVSIILLLLIFGKRIIKYYKNKKN